MTRQVFPNVEPIRPGYDWSTEIGFAADFWDAYDLSTGRIVAQFRRTLEGAVLFEADTGDGSITRPGGNVLAIAIAGDDSAGFDTLCVFDFVRIDGDARTAIPGRWQWPVVKQVTRDVE